MGIQAIGFTLNWLIVKRARVSSLGVTISHADTRSYTSCKRCTIEGDSDWLTLGTLVAWYRVLCET